MGGDVASALALRVATQPMGDRPSELGRPPEPAGRQRERLPVERRPAQQAGQVRAGPQAVHVGLAAAGLAADEQLDEGPPVVDVDLGTPVPPGHPRMSAASPSGRTTTSRPTGPGSAADTAIRQARRDRIESARRGSRPAVMGWVIGVASLCRWNRAPRSHSRRACQWIRPIVLWVTNGCRTSIRSDHPVGQAPPSEVQARVQQQPVARVLVDRDPQPRRLVADPDRVAAGHLDERRDVERLVHRVDQLAAPSVSPRRRVQVALAVGVVDLDDHRLEVAGAVPAQDRSWPD